MRRMSLTLAGALLLMPATALAQHDHVKAEIEAGSQAFETAFNAGDGGAVGMLYTEDAQIKPPNSAPIEGRAAITEYWSAAAGQGTSFDLTTTEVYSMGDMAWEMGTYVGTAEDGSHLDHGHYSVLWKKVDGEWKLHRDSWSSDMSM